MLDARCVRVFPRLAVVTFLPSFHLPRAITFVLVIKQRIYTSPSGNHLLWELILFKTMSDIPVYITEVVIVLASFVPGGFFERDL